LISPSQKNGIGGTRGDSYWDVMEESSEFKIKFKTIHTSCSLAVKIHVIPDLWSTNRKGFVSRFLLLLLRSASLPVCALYV